MMGIVVSDWTYMGNREYSAVVYDDAQPGNYKSVFIRPIGLRSWEIKINGEYRGSRLTMRGAKVDAISLTKRDLSYRQPDPIDRETGLPWRPR